MKQFLLLFTIIICSSCVNEASNAPKEGPWKAVLLLKDKKELPFLFDFAEDTTMTIINADERIEVKDIRLFGDSIYIEHPVFEGIFKGIYSKDSIYGSFIKPSLDRVVPFKMEYGRAARFAVNEAPHVVVTGNWETVFSPDSEADRYIAKGIFEQKGNRLTGTFRTTTGDYRYLDGVVVNDSIKLSTFDGAHAFLFEAELNDSIMTGLFYSGDHWKEPFTAKRNDTYELPKAETLTYLKTGYDSLTFAFPNVKGDTISLDDAHFKNKVTVVQIMGTWCPNCLDESKYYKTYYDENKGNDLEFVSLAFEYAPTKEKAIASIERFQKSLGIQYPILLAQYGSSDKKKANEKLPMLNHVLSYPTTIFIDKNGKVRKIHTGFNGPATGEKYDEFVLEFEAFVAMLRKE
ncbi:peroxiredoxin family protein [Cochleicola gelatinilyticus]|uniref:Redoxin n=1 Tax=Cochleicola gelatinilyticus TaxID=1763537 RepID=A0A167HFW2_9FLAO|nr:TlpA disulfide reductase family protein [Cochleicola gelatinilyticus]OAB78565.1 redoxin [Cochleicola gelatinilyticus]